MEFVMTIGNWIATKIAEYTFEPIVRQAGYVAQYKTNIEDLQTQVDNLASLKVRVQHKVKESRSTNKKIEEDVEKWLENAGTTIEKAKKFFEEERQSNQKCLHGFCPNLKPRHQLSRKSTIIKEDVVKLQAVEKGDKSFIRQYMDPTEFCQLKFLSLVHLPQFIGFSSIGGSEDEILNNSAPLFNWKFKFPKSLEELKMKGLDRLTSIWPDHDQLVPPEFTSKFTKLSATDKQLNICRNLRIIRVDGCQSLKYVFPSSAARGLEQLVELTVTNCRSIKEIITKEEGDDDADEIIKFVFPKLEKLCLRYLPQLGSFYLGMHTYKWPSLTWMEIIECEKVEILAADISTFHHQHDQATTSPKPLFLIEKGSFPKLASLEVTAEEYLCGLLSTHAEWFPRLTKVNLICMRIKSTVSPIASLLKLPALQDLTVQRAFFKEIFTVDQVSGAVNGGLTNFKLWKLPKLMHLWDENSLALQHHAAAPPIFQNTDEVEVRECRRLKNLVPFAISFPNLKSLELSKCGGLNYLFTYSAATSLTKLESIDIEDCKTMTEIISVPSTNSGDDHDHDHTMILGGLKFLRLRNLPSLAGFCSGNSINIKMPFLQHLIVINCGVEMEISPDGILVITDSKSAERSLHLAEEQEDDDYIVYKSI
ncbi:hypothetical protein FEM48_Zijuj07G0017400 [Ziziphus jujuba var. spinosa]|uniref:Disease resistance protein At4g27190-like leucine-rich repeats domain-containing protein n=1 Tax=Ziziphus jujuba var. spinosa TaxID=714518 RepID=A0A978V1Q8_ZIZJJ|nr:hypothetical protein FEM48_Zijuj07G0017400 [Ziziphus jujuba var. spinosa]